MAQSGCIFFSFFFFLSRSCETWIRCLNTSRRLGVSQFRCSASETTTLHATQPSSPLGAPSSHHTSSERDGRKTILSQNNWQLRERGNKDEPRIRNSRSTHPWLPLVKICHNRSKTFLLTNKVPNDEATDNMLIFFSSTTKEQPSYFFTSRSSMTGEHFKIQIWSWLVAHRKVCD